MHLPDGFLSARVAVGSTVFAALGLGIACARVRRAPARPNSALLGVSAAFVFAAQLVNFPVAAGTSGHLVGGALCAALLGLPAAIVVMSAVLIVQCLAFADGGLLALGANVVNMALVGCTVGYCVNRLVCASAPSHTRRVAAASFAGFCAVVASAAACAEEIALSGTARLAAVLPAMVGVHGVIGLGEAVITGLVVASVLRARPELVVRTAAPRQPGLGRGTLGYGLFLLLILTVLLAPLASTAPDGLTRVGGWLGLHAQQSAALSSPFTDYHVPGLGLGVLATIAAGALGTLVAFGLCWGLALVLVPRRATGRSSAERALESSG